jgi:hypothetical protein
LPFGHSLQISPITGQSSLTLHSGIGFAGQANTHLLAMHSKPAQLPSLHETQFGGGVPQSIVVSQAVPPAHDGSPLSHLP